MDSRTPPRGRPHGLRYPSDLTDAEWALVEPMIPPARRGGRRATINVREVLNAIFYVLSTGCQWKALPKDLPPKSTAHYYFMLWDWDGTLERIHHALYVAAREQADAKPARRRRSSTARAPRPLKKGLCARPAGLRCGQEGHGSQAPHPRRHARPLAERRRSSGQHPGSRRRRTVLSRRTRRLFPFIERIFADAGYQGPKLAAAVADTGRWTIEIVKRSDTASLRRPAQAMDRRTDLRLDQPQPPPRARFRALRQNRRRLHPPRHDPHHAHDA